MAKLIVKPTINFLSTLSDARLLAAVRGILKAMTANSNYPDPDPTLASIAAAADQFDAVLTQIGGTLLTARKNAKRSALVALMRLLASYVTLQCGGDLVVLFSSGFPIHKPTRHRIGYLDRPNTPKLKHGPREGELNARTRPVHGAFIYNWRLALADAPDQILQTAQSTGTRVTLTGLTPGRIYLVSVNVVGYAGATDFSNPARLMVI